MYVHTYVHMYFIYTPINFVTPISSAVLRAANLQNSTAEGFDT